MDSTLDSYIVVAHYENDEPYVPKKEMEIEMVQKLEQIGFKPFQIRMMFEHLKPGKLMLEMENVLFSAQLSQKSSPYDKLLKTMKETYRIKFNNKAETNRMKGIKNLQKYAGYLKKNKIKWTYINVYYESSKIKIGSIYSDEPIPKRMID